MRARQPPLFSCGAKHEGAPQVHWHTIMIARITKKAPAPTSLAHSLEIGAIGATSHSSTECAQCSLKNTYSALFIICVYATVPCHHPTKPRPIKPCIQPQTNSGVTLYLEVKKQDQRRPEWRERRTDASKKEPSVNGMKRGAWKSIVDNILWYTQRPMARARFPGRNSGTSRLRS